MYLRHVGGDQAVADANHVLFFNEGEGYQVSHPVTGGDASLVLSVDETTLRELAPKQLVCESAGFAFNQQHLRIDARAQALVMLLKHSLQNGSIEPLEAEGLSLTLVSRTLGPRTSRVPGASYARRRLVDRVKVLLAGDLSRRWTLGEIAAEMKGSAGISHAGVSAGGRAAALSVSPAIAARARARSDCRARGFVRSGTGSRLLQPQPFLRGVQAALRGDAGGVPRERGLMGTFLICSKRGRGWAVERQRVKDRLPALALGRA